MKKIVSLVLVAVMLTACLAACGNGSKEQEYKLGMGINVSTASSADEKAQVDATVAVVVTDANGKIVDCAIDVAQNKMAIAGGVAEVGQTYKTKQEKKEEYGMAGVSGIGKEWYEQANFFADYVVGKTVAEVEAIALQESNGHMVATDADILAGCTMDITAFITAISKACKDDQAKTFKSAAPTVGLSAVTSDSSSKDATADESGVAAMYTTFGGTAVVDGKIVAAIVDVIQPKIAFDQAGVIGDVTFGGTKRELKEDYGMAGVSGIGKEWYEQANFFTDYVAGKTASEISAISTVVDGSHILATDADILAGCTMSIGEFITVLANSAK